MEIKPLRDNCPNIHCSNKLGEGTFVSVSFPANIVGDKPVQILMCRPCSEIVATDINRAKEIRHG